jgi:hypothetical protein
MPKPGEVLKAGHWTYDGKIRCRVEIQFAILRLGSGDDQDVPEWRDDQQGSWFVLSYSSPTDPDHCPPTWISGQGCATLEQARAQAEATLQNCNLRWDN